MRTQKFAAVQSKCTECALFDIEEECVNREGLKHVNILRALHGTMYRTQRQHYHDIRERSIRDPESSTSCIGDGMAQVHNSIPWYGRSGSNIVKTFDTHLQGIIVHGRRFTLFRSFGNVGKGTNVAIHAWLCELEQIYIEKGKLPDDVYFQIDGGPENANAAILGLAELMLHRGKC